MNNTQNKSVPPLRNIQFHPSNRCNVDCLFCWVHNNPVDFPEIPDQTVLDLLGEAMEMGVRQVTISGGGEPLVRPSLVERMVASVKERPGGSETSGVLITNATVISEALAERLARLGWDDIHVSVQGSSPEVDSAVRNRAGALERTIEGIRRINDWKRRLGTDRPKLVFKVILTRLNAHDFLAMTRLADSLEVAEIYYRVVNEGDHDFRGDLSVRPEQVPDLIAQVHEAQAYSRSARIDLKLEFDPDELARALGVAPSPTDAPPLPAPTSGEDSWEAPGDEAADRPAEGLGSTLPSDEARPILCAIPFYEMVVFATGVASPCCNFFDSQVGIKWGDGDDLVCNALDRGIQGAWQSEEFAEFRRRMVDFDPPSRCKACSPDLRHYVSEVLQAPGRH